MLIWRDTRARAEAAAGPSPLALAMLRAARDVNRAEARGQHAQDDGEAVALRLTRQQAQAELEAAVARFCSEAPTPVS